MPYYDDELPEEYAEMGAVMYWKDRAEKAEADNAALNKKIDDLFLRIEGLEMRLTEANLIIEEYEDGLRG